MLAYLTGVGIYHGQKNSHTIAHVHHARVKEKIGMSVVKKLHNTFYLHSFFPS